MRATRSGKTGTPMVVMRQELLISLLVVVSVGCGGRTGLEWRHDAGSDRGCTPGCRGGPCAPGEWALICAGTFTMGSPISEEGHTRAETQHEVVLTHDLELQATEVTLAQFGELMSGYSGPYGDCGPSCPVDSVDWHRAAEYCNALSASAGSVCPRGRRTGVPLGITELLRP